MLLFLLVHTLPVLYTTSNLQQHTIVSRKQLKDLQVFGKSNSVTCDIHARAQCLLTADRESKLLSLLTQYQ